MIRAAIGFFLLVFSLAAVPCAGQGLVLCSSGLKDSLGCPQLTLDRFWGKGGRPLASDAVLYQGKVKMRVCSLEAGVLLVGFGNEHSNGEAFTLTCATTSPTAPFNNFHNGVREGLWFHRNVFGTITQAAQYHEGELQSVLHFWANGLPRQRVFYQQGKPRRGQKRYDKKGYPMNGMLPF
ncbi:hypothetical protein KB206_18630 [Microvirga sp. STS02]|uniref:toxin-antitoxin system YwqK family antitoxin n=1 Tax=Hymenobacter negativus TaxID=2795026 RepID=UPI0018DE4A01|nr:MULTISPECIES: hypothetical protein [Bacteria]MBH8570914.1 hypothetical protein [Hymenobacter negativus]MBR7210652.1 hypothetical protein [Microvirga sp. STS02]